MGVHNMDVAFWALNLGLPTSAEVIDAGRRSDDGPPLWNILRLDFPSGHRRGPVKMMFYDGAKLPPADLFHGEAIPPNGSLIIGSKGTLFTRTWHGGGEIPGDMFMLLPRREFINYIAPAPTLPRTREHHYEFIQACKGGPKTQSNFGYAAELTEALLVGQLALRTGRKIEWNAKKMEAVGFPEASRFIHPEFRSGWSL
jgi:hypothetical protein